MANQYPTQVEEVNMFRNFRQINIVRDDFDDMNVFHDFAASTMPSSVKFALKARARKLRQHQRRPMLLVDVHRIS